VEHFLRLARVEIPERHRLAEVFHGFRVLHELAERAHTVRGAVKLDESITFLRGSTRAS
jgi:hypothetical protein